MRNINLQLRDIARMRYRVANQAWRELERMDPFATMVYNYKQSVFNSNWEWIME
jgi:hypothetical protein